MPIDALILNTAVLDLRSARFDFIDRLVGAGGLAKCPPTAMPSYTPDELEDIVAEGGATPGGCANVAPLLARAGLRVAVGAWIGAGPHEGLDIQGRAFRDRLAAAGVDVSALRVHPSLPTGTTFIHDTPTGERGGIAYFPNANDDFDFDVFEREADRLGPSLVHYMYSGLSARGDANGGRDLADFLFRCRERGALTMVDSHTLTGDPAAVIAGRRPVEAYRLLEPLWACMDVFFTSLDEARMILNTLEPDHALDLDDADAVGLGFLEWAAARAGGGRPRLFGVTVSDGAIATRIAPDGRPAPILRVRSRFLSGEVVDLVGAGDSFRAGLILYLTRFRAEFEAGRCDVETAVQAGNLMASLFIKAPLQDRCRWIPPADSLLRVATGRRDYTSFGDLLVDLRTV